MINQAALGRSRSTNGPPPPGRYQEAIKGSVDATSAR